MTGSFDKMEGDWVEWSGGECPVPYNTTVFVKTRSGLGLDALNDFESCFDWDWLGQYHPMDIVAYRVVKP
jgi:hypothetical protein